MAAMANQGSLQILADPIEAFQAWFNEAVAAQVAEPTAMTLATCVANKPSARIVLYKGLFDGGLTFVTNYESRKSLELNANPVAALVFHWQPLGRQVRVEGAVHKLSAEDSDKYFASRPRGSQIGAWSSPQSRVIDDREDLLSGIRAIEKRFEGVEVPRPANWGGWVVVPGVIEFWEEREFRVHERLRFTRVGSAWKRERLAP